MAHGVQIQESSVGARPAAQVDSALPVYVGTAKIHETSRRANVNIPLLFATLAEAVEAFGPNDEGTLYEAVSAHFEVYGVGPIACINVLDPGNAAHITSVVEEEHTVVLATDPIPLLHPEALAISLLERSSAGDNVIENILYVGAGNGTLISVLVSAVDPTDVGAYSVTCTVAATPEAYAVENIVYVGVGNGVFAGVLTEADPTDAGSYTLTCTAAAAGPDPAEFQLAKAAVPVGAVVLADGTTQVRGGIAISITEGGVVFLPADVWSFDITYAAAVAASFTVVTPQTPGGTAIDADGLPHAVDGIVATISEGTVAFAPTDEWTFDVAVTAVAWTPVLAADYDLEYDDDDNAQVQPDPGGAILDGDTIRVTYTYLDESKVVAADIVGGYAGGVYTGLNVVHQVYPRLLVVPTLVLAPRWSATPAVWTKMLTVARSISGQFRGMAFGDLSPDKDDIGDYTLAAAWKAANGFSSYDGAVCWPAITPQGVDFPVSMATHLACLCAQVDHEHGDLPFASPSNHALATDGAVLSDAGAVFSELYLEKPQANALNGQGIVTALQSAARGWIAWGNRTAIYPSDTDPRVAFIPVRRMMNHLHNVTILTVERDVDAPGNRVLIDGVLQTMQAYLNGLVAAGALVGMPSVEFLEEDNPAVDMADGKFVFTYNCAPPSPGEDITFKVNYDATMLAALFD